MIKGKSAFGFTMILTENEKEAEHLFAYCDSKSTLWNWFFGWRETRKDDSMLFLIPTKKIKKIEKNY